MYLLRKYGIHTRWKPVDQKEIQRFHTKLWEKWKRDYQKKSGRLKDGRLDSIPGFVESLQTLILMGYSKTDIGTMIGVGRERVRQWVQEYGLRGNNLHGSMCRVWSDEMNSFVPISTEDMIELLRKTGEQIRRRKFVRQRKERRREHVRALRLLAEELGQSPTANELASFLGYYSKSSGALMGYWVYRQDQPGSHAKACSRLYRAAGIPWETGGYATKGVPRPRTINEREEGTLGYCLTSKRLKLGLTQDQVAVAIGLAPSSVNVHETNRYLPSDKTLGKYAKLHGVTVEWLKTGKEVERSDE